MSDSIAKNAAASDEMPLFEHDRYQVIGNILKRGSWGRLLLVRDKAFGNVYVAKPYDPTSIAKKQLMDRGQTLIDIAKNESSEFDTPDHVVSAWAEIDKHGRPFMIMRKYEGDLEQIITEGQKRLSYNDNTLALPDIITWIDDIIVAVKGYHARYSEAHGDIKADNLLINKERRLWLSDSGTSTGTSILADDVTRANMGHWNIRAPENFRENSRPNYRSDVWSVGSLLYRLFTGRYILEDVVAGKTPYNPDIASLDDITLDRIVDDKVKEVPFQYRAFVKRCLTMKTDGKEKRYTDGSALASGWKKTVEKSKPSYWLSRAASIIGASMTLIAGAYSINASLHEPIPETFPIHTIIEEGPFVVRSNYVDIDISLSDQHRYAVINPRIFDVEKDTRLSPYITVYFNTLPDSMMHSISLQGSIGFEGYESIKFIASPLKRGTYDMEGVGLSTYFYEGLKIPEDIPRGATINLEVRLYSPDSASIENYYQYHKGAKRLSFPPAGSYLATRTIPVHVGSLSEDSMHVIAVSELRNVGECFAISNLIHGSNPVDEELQYLVRIPEKDTVFHCVSEDNIRNYAYIPSIVSAFPDGKKYIFQLIAFKDEKLVYQRFLQLKSPDSKGFSSFSEYSIPEPAFAEKIMQYAKDTQGLINTYAHKTAQKSVEYPEY